MPSNISHSPNMVLFVGSYLASQREALAKLSKQYDKKLSACVLVDIANVAGSKVAKDSSATVLKCDFSSLNSIQKTLDPYKKRFLAVTCRAEKNIPLLKKAIPHLPYLDTPTETSLDWATNKIRMRQMLRGHDQSISPKFLVVHDASPETISKIEKKVSFPVMIKPAGLAASLLVTLCYHQEELEANLRNTVRKINKIYKERKGRGEPQILVEGFMEGTMYTVDSYVDRRGKVYHTPLVHVRTGRSVGYEDFFGYVRITPVVLKPHKVEEARKTVEKAIRALNLRSTTCHTELMKTEFGWKIIEMGPRIGGFRHEMYELSYGIDHSMNDILIRIPKRPILPKRTRGFTAVMQFYPRQKGRLVRIRGITRIRRLESFKRVEQKKKIGDMCNFARNGDDPVFDVVLFNKERSKLLADIRRLEQNIKIDVKKQSKPLAKKTQS